MSLEVNGVNAVNPFGKKDNVSGDVQETKINSVFGNGYNGSNGGKAVNEGGNEYFTNAMKDGNVSYKKSFLNLSNSYNFKVGDNETLNDFCKKMGLSPEMVMDNIIGGGTDLNCKAPMGPDGTRFINISEKDLAEALGKSPQELREMF
ncbi:TPA: hypothetical protein IAC10_00215 [Candidatus Scatousia excrementigallinarum]|uniref:Uncharacterized protein n=1 Tax=Candidatus Scatousia excrementigallinarum TaxID=2840935 RepID=A0A9D1EWJ5_9BACT|nr:hypothetical protein [Candidatus Scatousia excrementigallinarum]